MEISRTTVGVIAAICIAAGAGGAYFVSGGGRSPVAPETEVAAVATDLASLNGQPELAPVDDPTPAERIQEPASRPAGPSAARPVPAAPSRPQARASVARPEPAPSTGVQLVEAPSPEPREALSPAPAPISQGEPEPTQVAEQALPEFEELVVPADSVVGLQVETSITSERAQVEDEVVARVTRDVRVDGRVAIPAGAKAHGEVTLVERGGRLRERARLGVRFLSIVLPDGTRVPLETDTIFREGDAPGRESTAKIGGGAIGGAIIGGILGGAKGAVIGGSAGAGAGTAAVLAGGRNPATLPSGTPVTVRVIEPMVITVERP